MKFVIAVSRFLLWVSVASVLVAEGRAATPIDAEKSVTVRVFKAGVFSAFGHEHEISAPIRQGLFTENPASVKLIVDTRKMRVMDKDVSEKHAGSKVLDSEKFPEIRFLSTSVERLGEGKWSLLGDLTTRDETRAS